MTAVSADNTKAMQAKVASHEGFYVDFPVAASTTIYRNTFVGLDKDGYLTSYVAPTAYLAFAMTSTSFRGIAVEHVDNSSGSDGDKTCHVLVSGYFTYYLSGVAVTDVGCPVYVADNATLTADASVGHSAGYIVAYDRASYATIKLDPFAQWAGKMLVVTSPAFDFCAAVNTKIMLVHGTDNHNGLLLNTCAAYSTEVSACTAAAGVITIQHDEGTTDVSMGCTLTVIDNMASLDLIQGAGGGMLCCTDGAGTAVTASNAALVKAPAGYNVNAELTTASDEAAVETGQCKIFATFFVL